MIAHFKGTILQKHPGQVVIDISGVGYSATVPLSTFFKLDKVGRTAELFIRGIITAALERIGVALVPNYCVTRELMGRRLKNVFPSLDLMEDQFYIYQKKKKSSLQKHRILVDYLNSIKPAEFGEP